MRIFDILGPVMVGPSSSHTAGAVRIGLTARRLLGSAPVKASIALYGSFALTGRGHGTDSALIAGLLGMQPDDLRIPDSFEIAKKQGLELSFSEARLSSAHPNTAVLTLEGSSGERLSVTGESIGGGRIRIRSLNGISTDFSGEANTLIVRNEDAPGHAVAVTEALSSRNVNIATMQLYRNAQGKDAVMVLECDQPIPDGVREQLLRIKGIRNVTVLNKEEVI